MTGNSSRKRLGSNERALKLEKKIGKKIQAITDLIAPHGSRDIPFHSQEFGQDGYRHFVDFQPHFHINMTSQIQCHKTMKK